MTASESVPRAWAVCLRASGITPVLVLAVAVASPGQHFRVGVQITERTGGLFQSAFTSGLRALQDVDVVAPEERPDLLFKIVVLCQPETDHCDSATSYTLAINLVEPLTRASASSGVYLIRGMSTVGKPLSEREWDSLTTLVFQTFKGYEFPRNLWTLSWGRDVYRRAVDEFIAQFDSRCLERQRLMHRSTQKRLAGDSAAANALFRRWLDTNGEENWMC